MRVWKTGDWYEWATFLTHGLTALTALPPLSHWAAFLFWAFCRFRSSWAIPGGSFFRMFFCLELQGRLPCELKHFKHYQWDEYSSAIFYHMQASCTTSKKYVGQQRLHVVLQHKGDTKEKWNYQRKLLEDSTAPAHWTFNWRKMQRI